MSNFLGRRAVVIGAGIGGLAAAGALANYFERVDILERDRLAGSAGSRPGTPQDRHPHGLLAGGLRALDEIFRGFKSGLAAAGAVPVSFAREVQFEQPDVGVLPKRDFGISVLCATRPADRAGAAATAEAVANITLRPAAVLLGTNRALLHELLARSWRRLDEPVRTPAWHKLTLVIRHGLAGR